MRHLACITLFLLATACATAPGRQLLRRRHSAQSDLTDLSSLRPRIQLVSAPGQQAPVYSLLGKADLEQARALLARARNDLEPQHWALLDRKLTEAEQAWERFALLARTSTQAPEVVRGPEGLARARQVTGALSRVGPLLVALVLLWPSSTAGPEVDRRPPWLDAQLELEARLRDVSAASQQLIAQLETQSDLEEADDTEFEAQASSSTYEPPDCKGQLHHIISRTIARELERHKTLRGLYQPRDPRFVSRAVDEKAHCGYQEWHRDVDDEVVRWLQDNPQATPEQFMRKLREIYSRSDMLRRFPHGF